jgi:hypothetical protein
MQIANKPGTVLMKAVSLYRGCFCVRHAGRIFAIGVGRVLEQGAQEVSGTDKP